MHTDTRKRLVCTETTSRSYRIRINQITTILKRHSLEIYIMHCVGMFPAMRAAISE
jgi:hypothetical protein